MNATQDLIAAALRLTALAERNTDDRDEWQHSISEVREMCARAMVQPVCQQQDGPPEDWQDAPPGNVGHYPMSAPEMAEVERLINEFGVSCDSVAKRGHITSFKPLGQQITEHRAARTTLLDAVRGVIAERDVLIADNERLSGLYEQAVKGRADMRSALRDARAAAPRPVSAAEVQFPMPDKTLYGADRTVSGHFYTAAKVRAYGDAREAAGYARGLAEVNAALNDVFSAADGLSSAIDAALRGEVK